MTSLFHFQAHKAALSQQCQILVWKNTTCANAMFLNVWGENKIKLNYRILIFLCLFVPLFVLFKYTWVTIRTTSQEYFTHIRKNIYILKHSGYIIIQYLKIIFFLWNEVHCNWFDKAELYLNLYLMCSQHQMGVFNKCNVSLESK